MSFFAELKRRNVIRMAGLYLVGAWLIVQVAETLLPMFHTPDWVLQTLVLLLALGFVPTLVFSWIFELTPDGLKRDSKVVPGHSIALQTARRMDLLTLAGVLLVVLLIVADRFWPAATPAIAVVPTAVQPATNTTSESADNAGPDAASDSQVPFKSVAVLPFENLSADPNNAYFADGIQDEILTGLAKIGEIKVISRTSTARYASRPDNIGEIAAQLQVAHIVEGSVQRSGNRVRVIVQLIEASSDNHLWAEKYDRELDDVFAVQSEVAQKIADSLRAQLTQDERAALKRKPTENAAAYSAYLKARSLNVIVNGTREDADRMLDAYRDAVALDPGFALAWSELARELIRTGWIGLDLDGTLATEAKRALERAHALDPDLPQARMAHGVYLYYVERDFPQALEVLTRVQQQLPNDADVWMFIGFLSRRLGLWEQSVAGFERAHALAPNDYTILYHLAVTWSSMRRCDRAQPLFVDALALQPGDPSVLSQLLTCLWSSGDMTGAATVLGKQDVPSPALLALRATQAQLQRDPDAAIALYRQAIASDRGEHLDFFLGGYVDSKIEWQLMLAWNLQQSGKWEPALAIYREIQTTAAKALATAPEDGYVVAGWHAVMGLALAGLDEKAAAAEQGERVVELAPIDSDRLEGPLWLEYRARIHARNGAAEAAVRDLRTLLDVKSSWITPALLRQNPEYDAIRNDPAFISLLDALASDPEASDQP